MNTKMKIATSLILTDGNEFVAYFKKVTVPICAGRNCLIGQYPTKYAFHHFRSQ
ncbi:hypothetical protein [Gemella sp.]